MLDFKLFNVVRATNTNTVLWKELGLHRYRPQTISATAISATQKTISATSKVDIGHIGHVRLVNLVPLLFCGPPPLEGAAYCVALCLSVRLSVCLSVCPSVRPVIVFVYFFYSRTVLRANIQNRKTSVFAYGPASRMYFSARTEGRIYRTAISAAQTCYLYNA